MDVGTLFAFLAAGVDAKLSMVSNDDDSRLTTHRENVFGPLPNGFCNVVKAIDIFAVLHEPQYDAVYGYVATEGTEELLWTHYSSIVWFPIALGRADAGSIPASDLVSNKDMVRGARFVVHDSADVRVSVHEKSTPSSVAGLHGQFMDFRAEVDSSRGIGGDKDQSGWDRFRLDCRRRI